MFRDQLESIVLVLTIRKEIVNFLASPFLSMVGHTPKLSMQSRWVDFTLQKRIKLCCATMLQNISMNYVVAFR